MELEHQLHLQSSQPQGHQQPPPQPVATETAAAIPTIHQPVTATYPSPFIPAVDKASNWWSSIPVSTAVRANQAPVHQIYPQLLPKVCLQDKVQQMMTSPGVYAMKGGLVYRLEDTQGSCEKMGYVGYHATPNMTYSGKDYQP